MNGYFLRHKEVIGYVSDDSKKLLTPIEVAQRLGVSPATLRSWRDKKMHIAFVKIGGLIKYQSQDVERFIANSRREV